MGDLNGRTKTEEDFVRDIHDEHSPINYTSCYTRDSPPLCRQNMDEHTTDEQGKLILALCKSSSLRILNGRTPGDLEGSLTRYPSNLTDNPSTIDYALCSEYLIKDVLSFSVLPFNGLSDHCCISLTVSVDIEDPKAKETKQDPLKKSKYIFKFDITRKHVYEQALKDDTNVEELRAILAQANNSEDVDRGITKMNTILVNAAKKASFAKRSKCDRNTKKQQPTHHDWYNRDCKAKQRFLIQCSKKLSSNPFDRERRQIFTKARAEYKKVCRKAETIGRQKLTKKLIELGQNDPKKFWDTIKKMNNWGEKKTDPCDDIDVKTWVSYFEKLLNDKNSHHVVDVLGGRRTFEPILDSMITLKELRDAIGNLKSGKAAGPDEINGEYLKIFGQTFEGILLKLVNIIFSKHIYPSKWALNFLKPIFKKGSTKDPDNYRGLAIGSAFAKLFSFISLKRLTNI